MNPLISIIVPVYNVEKYIKKCVASLCAQTYENLEIILIDDGSPDMSGAICDELQKTDDRIVVLHQKNAGVSKARNAALDIMHGDYVTFVDADDYVAPDFIACLYHAIESKNADISTCGHYRVNPDSSLKRIYSLSDNPEEILCLTGNESIIQLFYGNVCSASSGSKLYKKTLFQSVRFPDYIMGEDTFVVYYTFKQAKMIAHTNKPLYFYVQHSGSVTNSRCNYIKFYDYVKLYDHIIRSVGTAVDKEFFAALTNRLIENNFWVYMKLRNCPNLYFAEKRHIEDNIKKYRKYVIANPNAELRVRAACLLSYGGMHALDMVYDKINRKN